jgi:hypothetical protein
MSVTLWCLASWCWTPEQWVIYFVSLAISVGLVGWAYWPAIKWRSLRVARLTRLSFRRSGRAAKVELHSFFSALRRV